MDVEAWESILTESRRSGAPEPLIAQIEDAIAQKKTWMTLEQGSASRGLTTDKPSVNRPDNARRGGIEGLLGAVP